MDWCALFRFVLAEASLCSSDFCQLCILYRMNPTPVIPSPSGHFILGQLPQILREGLFPAYLSWQKQHGDTFQLCAPKGNNWYFFAHPDEVEQILLGSYRTFHKGVLWNRVRRILGNGLLTNDGDLWRDHRRAMQPVFSPGRHPDFAAIMSGAIVQMVERWQALAKRGEAFDVLDEMSRVTIQNAGLTLFSTDFAPLYDRMGDDLNFVVRRMNVFNFWKARTADPRLYVAFRKLHTVIAELISNRRRAMNKDEDVPDDLLSALLRGRDSQKGEPFSDKELHDEILTFIFVGHETTALSLSWTWALLGQNREWMERAQAEVDTVLGDRPATLADLDKLMIVKNAFLETLRLYPPVWGIARGTTQEVSLGGFPVPKGATLLTLPYVTHRHPDFWPDAERFDPDRFLPEQEKTRPRYAYFPFGGGPRLCIGMGFAMLEAQLILSAVLQNFDLQLVENQKFDLALWATLRPKNGIHVRLKARESPMLL